MHESRVAPHMEGLVSPEVVTLLGWSGDRNDIFRNRDRSASQNYTGSHPMPLFSTVPSTVTSDWLSGLLQPRYYLSVRGLFLVYDGWERGSSIPGS